MAETMTGGCQCGRVRYAVMVDDLDAYLCHCRMCRRATGGFAAALKAVLRAALTWTAAEPERYASSPIARRGFCAACGTPLTYEGEGADGLDLTVGSFDEAWRLRPTGHSGAESMLRAWIDTHGLPETRTDELPHIVAKWEAAGAAVPD